MDLIADNLQPAVLVLDHHSSQVQAPRLHSMQSGMETEGAMVILNRMGQNSIREQPRILTTCLCILTPIVVFLGITHTEGMIRNSTGMTITDIIRIGHR